MQGILVFLVACGVLYAQSISGELTGTVYDQAGAVVSSAEVEATQDATGLVFKSKTTSTGQYRLSNLPIGTYTLTVTATGFARTDIKKVAVDLNKVATTNVTLQVGNTSTRVEVAESMVAIDTTTAQISSTFDTKQLADLPITSQGAGVFNLSLLSPGVSTSGTVGAGTGPSIGGQRPRNNNFTLEGVDNNSRSVTGPLVTVPNDAVAEFTLLQNQFSPEFGHSTGGQFNTVVKSGTNEFHGMLYEYLRNRNMNALDQQYVLQGILSNPRYDNNRLGANVGGPILKNKLFFFADFEYQPVGLSTTPGQIFAPTSAGYSALSTIAGINPNNLSVMQKYLGTASSAISPASLPNGVYPVVGGKSIESGQLSIAAPNYNNSYNGVLSADYSISDKDQLRGRFVYNRYDEIDNNATLPVFYAQTPYRYYLANISEFHTFSPTITNEFRLGFNRYNNVTGSGSEVFPGLSMFPNLTIDEYQVNIGPDPNAPQYTIINTYQLTDNLTWVKGAHTIKVGFNGQRFISPQGFTQRVRGDYEWSTLEGYLLDQSPDVFGERSAGDFTYWANQWQFGVYANDDWKIRPNFTINLGVRYEYQTVPAGQNLQSLNSISNVPGLITFGTPKAQTLNFMPRIGFAWSPGQSGSTSIRGGFGMGYDQLFDNLGILSLPPQVQQTYDTSTTTITPNFLATGGLPGSPAPLDATTARLYTAGFIPNQKLPKSIQWNIGVQHVFAQNYIFEARYVGTRGVNLPIQSRINAGSPVTALQSLPTYLTAPSQSVLDSLPLTLSALEARDVELPAYADAGFGSYITAYMPIGNSTYHGLALQLTRRFTNGLQFNAAYTWSHNIDDSTAEVFSTVTTPRRPQDFQDLRSDRSDSALDHRHRATLTVVYDFPFFKNRNWFMKNLVGNWEFAPIYTFQSGNWATVQSGIDSNLNGDSYGDRAVINPAGKDGVGSDVTPLSNSNGDVVAYLANNPNARYIAAGYGVFPNAARNTIQMPPIQNLDLTAMKRFSFRDRINFELLGQFSNTFNHPQFVGGYINDVQSVGYTGSSVRNYLNPASTTFNNPEAVFSSNPRTIQVALKVRF